MKQPPDYHNPPANPPIVAPEIIPTGPKGIPLMAPLTEPAAAASNGRYQTFYI